MNEKVLVVIPARGGSKGFPGKNVAELDGKPLIAHSILQAKDSNYDPHVVVSTEDYRIAFVSIKYGAEVIKRPDELAGDHVQSERAIEHVLAEMDYRPDIIVMLQCTSPVRRPRHIDEAIAMVAKGGFDSVLSGVWAHKFIWRWDGENAYCINMDAMSRPMRQHRPREFFENGSIYVFETAVLEKYENRMGLKRGIYEMPYWSQFEIDSRHDLEVCAWIMAQESLY